MIGLVPDLITSWRIRTTCLKWSEESGNNFKGTVSQDWICLKWEYRSWTAALLKFFLLAFTEIIYFVLASHQ
jgi:hypothetical protein